MNVAKKLMVSVVTNPTLAIVCSNVGSQVPHLQSQPPLSDKRESTSENDMYSTERALMCVILQNLQDVSHHRSPFTE